MGLIPNTQYAFRVSARNSVGLSDFSGAIRIYTGKEDQKTDVNGIRTTGPYTKGAKKNFNLIILCIGPVYMEVGSPSSIVFHRCIYMSSRVTLLSR